MHSPPVIRVRVLVCSSATYRHGIARCRASSSSSRRAMELPQQLAQRLRTLGSELALSAQQAAELHAVADTLDPARASGSSSPLEPIGPMELDETGLHAMGLRLPPQPGAEPSMPDCAAPELGRTAFERALSPRVVAALRGRLCWTWDLFELEAACVAEPGSRGPLCTLAAVVVEDHGLRAAFAVPEEVLLAYFSQLEALYRRVPYHNALHATDVLHALNYILSASGGAASLPRVELLAALLAAAAHDVGHGGVSNSFLTATRAPLALRYNDSSVLESFHASTALTLLAQPGCDLCAAMSAEQARMLRSLTISLVLATDTAQHQALLAQAQALLARPGGLRLDSSDGGERGVALRLALMCADVGNASKAMAHALRWGVAILNEFFAQGDQERALGLPLTPSCDRRSVSVVQAQLAFLDRLALPLFQALACLAPAIGEPALARTLGTRAFIASCAATGPPSE